MIKICHLHITYFGRIHYYGSLNFEKETINLKAPLNEKEAELISDHWYKYHKGEMSERISSSEKVIKIALKTWKKKFPNAVILLEGSSGCGSVQKCLDGDEKLKNKINKLYEQAEKIGWYEGNEKIMTKINDKYAKLIKRN
jgi:hypothetical protein